MTDSDRTIITHLDEGRFGSSMLVTAVNNSNSAVQQLHQRNIPFSLSQDTAGGTISQGVLYTDRALLVVGFIVIPGVAVAASNTNYKTISLVYNNGNAGSSTTVWAATTQLTTLTTGAGLGTLVANTVIASTWTALAGNGQWTGVNAVSGIAEWTLANTLVPANSLLEVTAAPTGTGVVVAPMYGQILVQEV